MTVIGQAPSGIEGLAKDLRTVAGKDRLEPHLRGHRVDGDGPFHQSPGAYRIREERDPVILIGRREIAGAMALGGLGMGLDHDARARMILLRPIEHLAKSVGVGCAMRHRGIATGLVDDQHISRFGAGKTGIEGGVFRQMRLLDLRHAAAGAVHHRGVIEGMGGKDMFKIGGCAAVEMDAAPVDHEAKRCLSVAPRMKRPQKGVLDTQKARPASGGHGLASGCCRALAPDGDEVIRGRISEFQLISGERQDPSDAALQDKSAIEMENPPGRSVPGGILLMLRPQKSPCSVLAAVPTEPTAPSVPVRAPTILAHWVNGASVT